MLVGCVIVRIVAGSIEQMLVDAFKQYVIVSVNHANSNQDRTWRFECFAQHLRDKIMHGQKRSYAAV
jgi:hypothetical protein